MSSKQGRYIKEIRSLEGGEYQGRRCWGRIHGSTFHRQFLGPRCLEAYLVRMEMRLTKIKQTYKIQVNLQAQRTVITEMLVILKIHMYIYISIKRTKRLNFWHSKWTSWNEEDCKFTAPNTNTTTVTEESVLD